MPKHFKVKDKNGNEIIVATSKEYATYEDYLKEKSTLSQAEKHKSDNSDKSDQPPEKVAKTDEPTQINKPPTMSDRMDTDTNNKNVTAGASAPGAGVDTSSKISSINHEQVINNPLSGRKYGYRGPVAYKHTQQALRHQVLDYQTYVNVEKTVEFFCHDTPLMARTVGVASMKEAMEGQMINLQKSRWRDPYADIRLEPINFNAKNLVDENMMKHIILSANGTHGFQKFRMNTISIEISIQYEYIRKEKHPWMYAQQGSIPKQHALSNDLEFHTFGMNDSNACRWSPYTDFIMPLGATNSYYNCVLMSAALSVSNNYTAPFMTNAWFHTPDLNREGGMPAETMVFRDYKLQYAAQGKQEGDRDIWCILDPQSEEHSRSRTKLNIERYYKDQTTIVPNNYKVKIDLPMENARSYTAAGLRTLYNSNYYPLNRFVTDIEGAQQPEDTYTKPEPDNFNILFAPMGQMKHYVNMQQKLDDGTFAFRTVPIYNIRAHVTTIYRVHWHCTEFKERTSIPLFTDYLYFTSDKIKTMGELDEKQKRTENSYWRGQPLKLVGQETVEDPRILPEHHQEKSYIDAMNYVRDQYEQMKTLDTIMVDTE